MIRPSTVELVDYFPIEPGFSVTIHKAQGRTIRRVILSISEHPVNFNKMTWEGLYVALSRVKLRDHIRLLLRNGDRTTMDYIGNLKKNEYTKCYFEGYTQCMGDHGVSAHPTSATQGQHLMRWNSRLASTKAGFIANEATNATTGATQQL